MPRKTSPANLPQIPITWHVTVRSLKIWLTSESELALRPTILLVTVPEERQILCSEAYPQQLDADQILDKLIETMKKPDKSTHLKAHRPKQMIFELEDMVKSLEPALKDMGIAVACEPARQEIDELFASFEDMLQKQTAEEEGESEDLPGILAIQGSTPEQVGRVWAAAADYYRAAPWQYLADAQPLALYFSPALFQDDLKQGTEKQGFVQLMGNGGMEFGIVFYWKWEDVLSSYEIMERNPLESIPGDGWNTFTFEVAETIPLADLDAVKKHGWEIAGPEAYPLPMIYFGDQLKRPGAEMLTYYEAALRAIPQFVSQLQPNEEDDYLALEMPISVETAAGTMTVTVRYPAGELPASIFLEEEFDEDLDYDEEEDLEDELPDFYFGDEDDDEDGEGDEDSVFLDQRAFEGELAALSQALEGINGEPGSLSPELNQAQQIMYRAWEERRPARRILLARKALEVSPDCADAYVLLAEEDADTPEQACELLEKGLQAGERALGETYFSENTGMFWGLIETRGYMRARAGLAECLEYLGRTDEAIAHYEVLLQLNPSDNQGIRYQLLALLVRNAKNSEAGKLLEDYKDDASAAWTYTRALLAFRRLGPSIPADAALRRAQRTNPHVPPYLNGSKPLPEELPDMIGFGDESEAVDYAIQHFGNWWNTRGAVAWLKEVTKSAQGGKVAKEKDKKKRRRS